MQCAYRQIRTAEPEPMTLDDIRLSRLYNQSIFTPKEKDPVGIVRGLVAVQGQDYSGGEWSIGLRLPGSKLKDIEKAISGGEIVRTWALRGTLHFLAGSDINWIMDLLAPGIIASLERRYKELEMDSATFRKTNSILEKALGKSGHLTRGELKSIIEKNGISCAGQRMTFILHRASLDKVICFGVKRGKAETHALFDEVVPRSKPRSREESLVELARRYFTSHGPATIQDYMWWSGLKAADAKFGPETEESALRKVSIEGNTYWMPKESDMNKRKAPVVHLLPPFDSFLIGYKDRKASIDKTVLKMLRTGGMPDATIVIDGRVAGKWSRKSGKDRVTIMLNTFRKLTGEEENALQKSFQRYGAFLEKEPESGRWRTSPSSRSSSQ